MIRPDVTGDSLPHARPATHDDLSMRDGIFGPGRPLDEERLAAPDAIPGGRAAGGQLGGPAVDATPAGLSPASPAPPETHFPAASSSPKLSRSPQGDLS